VVDDDIEPPTDVFESAHKTKAMVECKREHADVLCKGRLAKSSSDLIVPVEPPVDTESEPPPGLMTGLLLLDESSSVVLLCCFVFTGTGKKKKRDKKYLSSSSSLQLL